MWQKESCEGTVECLLTPLYFWAILVGQFFLSSEREKLSWTVVFDILVFLWDNSSMFYL